MYLGCSSRHVAKSAQVNQKLNITSFEVKLVGLGRGVDTFKHLCPELTLLWMSQTVLSLLLTIYKPLFGSLLPLDDGESTHRAARPLCLPV